MQKNTEPFNAILDIDGNATRTKAEPYSASADCPRLDLLAKLKAYGREHPEENATVSRFEDFVTAHDDAFLRSCEIGHVTGSAFIVDAARTKTLLVHHRKLDKWLQPGGHCEPSETALDAARREAREETGLDAVPASPGRIFDLDVHGFPARGDVPAHFHYDVRFLLVAEPIAARVSEESRAVEWMDFGEARLRNAEGSIARMIRKSTRSS